MVEDRVRKIVSLYLEKLRENGIPVSKGIVFGSQARGMASKWSDIDLLVVSPVFDDLQGRTEINLLWRVAARVDSRIEPIPCGEKQWEDDDSSTIIEYARREGEMLQ